MNISVRTKSSLKLPGGGGGVNLIIHIHLVWRLRMSGGMPPLSHICLHGVELDISTFTITYKTITNNELQQRVCTGFKIQRSVQCTLYHFVFCVVYRRQVFTGINILL